jgi:hypothetical protein
VIRRLVFFLVALVPAVFVLVEVFTPAVVEGRIEDRVEARVPDATSVDASIESFPFVTRLGLTGRVKHLTVDLDGVERAGLAFATISVDLDGIQLDREALYDKEFDLQSIDEGSITAEFTEEALSSAVGTDVQLEPGEAIVTVAGQEIGAAVEVSGGEIVLANGALRVPLPTTDLFPCDLEGEILAGRARLTCAVDEVPPILLRAAEAGVELGP